MHTGDGDSKFDLTPANEQHPNIHKMAEAGKGGDLMLLSGSTNANVVVLSHRNKPSEGILKRT